jgi:hypothetical protein
LRIGVEYGRNSQVTPLELDAKVGKKVRWKGSELYFNDWFLASDGQGGTKHMAVVSSGNGPVAIGNNAPLDEIEFITGPGGKP